MLAVTMSKTIIPLNISVSIPAKSNDVVRSQANSFESKWLSTKRVHQSVQNQHSAVALNEYQVKRHNKYKSISYLKTRTEVL
jgi:hypothetical protein